jgi:hypothetical protein
MMRERGIQVEERVSRRTEVLERDSRQNGQFQNHR